jgi:hypothetical protein
MTNHNRAPIFGCYAKWPGGDFTHARVLAWGRATHMKMFFLGLMVAFTPSMLVLAWTLRRAPENDLGPEAYTDPNKYAADNVTRPV